MSVSRVLRRAASRRVVGSIACSLLCSAANALDYNLDVEAGVGYTDNASRAPQGQEIPETLGLIELSANLEEITDRLTAILRSDLQFATYLRDNFDDETLGGIDLAVDYALVPEILDWVFVETFGQQATDPFHAVGTLNRENVNYATTGPRITAPLGPRNFMEVTALYSTVSYEQNPFDNDRISRQVSAGRRLSDRRSASIVYSEQSVSYDQPSVQVVDFDTEQWFLRWQSEAPRTDVQLDVGETTLLLPTRESQEPLLRASITRQLSSSTALLLDAGRLFADAGESFRQFQGSSIDVGASQDVIGTAAPFEDRYVSLGLSRQREASRMEFRVGRSKEIFGDSSLDRELATFQAELSREFGDAWSSTASFIVRRREFLAVNQIDDEVYARLSVDRVFSRKFSFAINVDAFDRKSTALGEDTEEQRIFVTLTYTPRTSGSD
jgi:hypothetical protein